MSDSDENKSEKEKKKPYDFGNIEKVKLKPTTTEVSVFGYAHPMPGGDGCDPMGTCNTV